MVCIVLFALLSATTSVAAENSIKHAAAIKALDTFQDAGFTVNPNLLGDLHPFFGDIQRTDERLSLIHI